MLYRGCTIKKRSDQRTPFFEQFRAPEYFGMVFQRSPTNEQDITGRRFDAVLKLVAKVARRLADDALGGLERGFEFGIAAGFDVDGGNFEDHVFLWGKIKGIWKKGGYISEFVVF